MKTHKSLSQDSFIPFFRPYISKTAMQYIEEALTLPHLQGDGVFTTKCHQFLEQYAGHKVLLTTSCTTALEMPFLFLDFKEGDEVIMPSYTFSSTATAVTLRGAVPVFVDVRLDTINIDESLIEAAITPKTKAILPVHYAGVSADMTTINTIAKRHNLFVIEDAAQGVGASYKGKPLGALSDFGALSFHGTKNLVAGEGGALIITHPQYELAAEIAREKGTNRSQTIRGGGDKYTWVDKGSSYLPSEITAALLLSQLEIMEEITKTRLKLWNHYHGLLEDLEKNGFLKRPTVPADCDHNGHIYYIVLPSQELRDKLTTYMKSKGIQCVAHYHPLHNSPAGLKYGHTVGELPVSIKIATHLLRLPLWTELPMSDVERVVEEMTSFFQKQRFRYIKPRSS